MIKQLLSHCFTGKDGESYDLGRILWAIGCLAAIGLSIYSVVYLGKAWDIQEFGIGFGVLLGGGGLSLKLKENTEPT